MHKVLIIEDEQLVARMFEKALHLKKLKVEKATNGQEGVAKMKAGKPSIVLMDVMMPEMSGLEALALMKQDPEIKDIPVVIVTNLSGDHDIEKAKKLGAVDFWIKKNMRPSQFVLKVEEIIAAHQPT